MKKKTKMIIATLMLVLTVVGCKPHYKLIKTGVVSHVEYLQGNFSASTKTIFYFTDGSTFVISRVAVNMPACASIEIWYSWDYGYEIRCREQ